MLKATNSEKRYIHAVLDHFKLVMPEATTEQCRAFAVKTLFRVRLWEVVYQFRVNNYYIPDVLDADYVKD